MADEYMLRVVPKRFSYRDVLRRERWALAALVHQANVTAYLATLTPEPVGGWQIILDAAWAKLAATWCPLDIPPKGPYFNAP